MPINNIPPPTWATHFTLNYQNTPLLFEHIYQDPGEEYTMRKWAISGLHYNDAIMNAIAS